MKIKIEKDDHSWLINGKRVLCGNNTLVFKGVQCNIIKKESKLIIQRKFNAVKPLYYAVDSYCVYIASNIYGIPAKYRKKVNDKKINEFLTYGFIFPPYTLWKDINKMPVLSCAQIYEKDNAIKFKLAYDFSSTRQETILNQNINLSFKKNNGYLMFSGGLDSIILAKMYQNQIKKKYASGFEFDKQDLIEKEYALSAADSMDFDINYQNYDINNLLKLLPEAILCTQMPLNHLQSLLIFKMLKDMPSKYKNVYNGQGADAIFGTVVQSEYFNGLNNRLVKNKIIDEFCTDKESLKTFENFEFGKEKQIKSCLDIDFYAGILGDCEITIQSWSLLAQHCKKNMIFPFWSEANYNLVTNKRWKERLCEPKHMLRELARELEVPEELISRKKASFGPVSTDWGKHLIPLIPICENIKTTFNINMSKIQKKECRYNLWNLINFAIWKMLFIDNTKIDIIKNRIEGLLKNENKFKNEKYKV